MTTRQSVTQIFAIPLLLAVISIAGLVSALVGDGWWDAFSWISLGLPVMLYLYYVGRRKPS